MESQKQNFSENPPPYSELNSSYPHPQATSSGYPQNIGFVAPQSSGYPYPQSSGYPNAPPNQGQYEPKIEVPHIQPVILQAAPIQIGPDPMVIMCPSCHAEIRTDVKHEPSTKTHLMAIILLLLCWPCTCIPYCIDDCQNANHYCPNCRSFIGAYRN